MTLADLLSILAEMTIPTLDPNNLTLRKGL